ncbi:ParA family protein [Citrobacter portucalensis]|uniref:ParA family protein n=1 Tax=Citrobacter portucalensis TaxID=1639133 RepID=UPI00226BAB89|nr:ParA family protein [Citrobacter portucalensis]MCX9038804.1 ParA family protein [Citrobacter portucalensis]
MGMVSVFSTKGGVGKTLTALNLAWWLQPAVIADTDVSQGLADLAGLGEQFSVTRIQDLQQVRAVLDNVKGLALVDCGGFDSDINRYVLALSDVILIPTSMTPPEQLGLMATSRVLAAISQATGKKLQGHVVINNVHPRVCDFSVIDELAAAAGNLSVMKPVIPRSASIPAASYSGAHVGGGEVASRYQVLAKNIIANIP